MSEEQERRVANAERRSGVMPRQRETPRTERLDPTAANPRWRPPSTSHVRDTTLTVSNLWQVFPRWLQERGWIYLITFLVIILFIFVLTLWLLRSDRREMSLGAPQPTVVTLPTGEANLLLGSEGVDTAPQSVPTPAPRFFVVVNTGGQGLFLRPQPNRNNQPITTLPDGTRLEQIGDDVPGEDRLWRPVRTPDGLEGYVAVDFLAPDR
ncbi:SH3 domain-containing protein [uncultured Chloroflexus sp.]|uniref:SH3 domain-containing protein n=1 Tax=uncultured Chloroflexus sp. TaxID=214040 RepID=UPI00261B3E5C|nr:SH3 domain-containing protein [uncultured Chloroflexus sp.]